MKKHWFTLHCDTFLWLKVDRGLVYNAENKTKFLFSLSDKIAKICCQLLKTTNLYTAELTDEDINDDEINQWINSLIYMQAGHLTFDVEFDKRPISLKPILKVQDNKNYYEKQHELGFKGKILQNLHELIFYINGSEYGNNEYFRQTVFPSKNCQVLSESKILSFIKNSRTIYLNNINIVGNLFTYPDFEKFIVNISDFSIPCTIYLMLQDFLDNLFQIKSINWQEHIRFNILADSVFDVSFINDINLPFSITALVFSDCDFTEFSTLLDRILETHEIKAVPLYNKKNLRFFESNVFLDNDDFENIDLSKNDIFILQTLNINNFGKLTVMPNEAVYANVNEPPLGTIDDSPYSLVYKEFTNGISWFNIRNQAPCNDCVYQWFCPSPSDYEIAIGRPNLCHVKQ